MGEHEHFCPIRKVLSKLFRFTFQNGDYEHCCDSEVVEILPFFTEEFRFYKLIWLILLDSKIQHYVSDRAYVYMIPHGWWREEWSVINRGFTRWNKASMMHLHFTSIGHLELLFFSYTCKYQWGFIKIIQDDIYMVHISFLFHKSIIYVVQLNTSICKLQKFRYL